MKAWRLSDNTCFICCRAVTRNAARAKWPGFTADFWDTMALRVTREPRLDGPGDLDYIDMIWMPCDCGQEDGCGECFEGERIDWDRTVAAQRAMDEGQAAA